MNNSEREAAQDALSATLDKVFAKDPNSRLRRLLLEHARTYRFQMDRPEYSSSQVMTRRRHKRLSDIRKHLDRLAREIEADRFILGFIDEMDDELLGDGWILLGELKELERVREVISAIDAALAVHSPCGIHAEKEARWEFWARVAWIYEEVTGRSAAVVKREDTGLHGGLFVELIQGIYALVAPGQTPPTVASIEHFADWWRDEFKPSDEGQISRIFALGD